MGLRTEEGDSGAAGGVNLDFHSGRHRGLRTEVSDLATPWAGIPGARGTGPPGREVEFYLTVESGLWGPSELRSLGQMSETLGIRQGRANFFPRGPDGKYLNLRALESQS